MVYSDNMSEETEKETVVGVNVQFLIDENGLSFAAAGRRTKVNDRMLKFIAVGRNSPSMDTVEKIGRAFGVTPWLLLHPDFPKMYVKKTAIASLVRKYAACSAESRSYIERAAEQETRYDRINHVVEDLTKE